MNEGKQRLVLCETCRPPESDRQKAAIVEAILVMPVATCDDRASRPGREGADFLSDGLTGPAAASGALSGALFSEETAP